ncbi:hypothetical protein KY289_017063 [Solanum tuberosum]|nr:hypothetical protein KY289_017063 [Solanum tuberosum]
MPTIKDSEGKDIPKPKAQYGDPDYKMLGKNAKAKCILVCGLGHDEFNRNSAYTSAKQIWDTLHNAHEGTTQVRKFRIARLSTEYESFKMKNGESLQDIITRFTTVINELNSLGKIYATEEQVDKVLRTLLRSWKIKLTEIREAKDLTNMTLDELVGNLKTYELNVESTKRSEGSKLRKKSCAQGH